MLELILGNRNYSSWSLRAWFLLRASGIEFDEVRLSLFTESWPEEIAKYSLAGRVPVLIDGDLHIWDSFAILMHLQETNPRTLGWPADPEARALARSISAEMHSGFLALRDELPQNIRARKPLERSRLSEVCQAQVQRVLDIWSDCRTRFGAGGPWLFGELCAADVMWVPVALRFRTYAIEVAQPARTFTDAVAAHPAIAEWDQLSAEEPESFDFVDDLVPASEGPLVLG